MKSILMFLLMAGSAFAVGEFRAFHVGDRRIEARVLKVNISRGEVELELRNKNRKKVKSSIFTEKDQNYIRDCAKVQEFQSQRFKVEVEKNVLDRKKELVGGAVQRETESICYDINLSNNTGVTMDGVTIAYNIFYEQQEPVQGKNKSIRLFVDGTLEIKSLAPRQKTSVQTKNYEIYDQRLAGGYDAYSDGSPSHQSGKSKGVWLKLHLKTPSGLTAMREVCLPKNTNEVFSWQTSEK